MTEKRVTPRKRRRLLVQMDHAASFTIDVSPRGFCLGTMKVMPVKSILEGSIRVDGGPPIPFEGRVAWVAPGDRRLNLPGKMGVVFKQAIPELMDTPEPQRGTK
jgi:hypothetical protein